jgi:hypothetical protein
VSDHPAGSDPVAATNIESDEISRYTNGEKVPKSPLFWLLGGIAVAVGGVVLFLTGKLRKKPGSRPGHKKEGSNE